MARLSADQLYELAVSHFGDLGPRWVQWAIETAGAESGGAYGSDAIGDNFKSGHQSADSAARYDYGPLQVNSQHGFDAKRLVDDPDYNFAKAREILDRQGPEAWATSKTVMPKVFGTGGRGQEGGMPPEGWKSTGGGWWTPPGGGAPEHHPEWDSSASDNNVLIRNFPDGSLRQSSDNGGTWQVIGESPSEAQGVSYSGSGLPAGYVQGSDGFVYKQVAGTRGGITLRRATPGELTTLNTTGATPQKPQTYTDERTGDLVFVDPFSGEEVRRIPGASWASMSPQQQAEIRAGELGAAREAAAGENALDRTATATENEKNRAAAAAQTAASIAQQQKQLDETIANNRLQAAQADQNLGFLYDKFAVETDANNRSAMLATQQAIWGAQRDVQQINFQYGQLQQQAAQFNAQQQFAVEQENQRRTEAQAERKRALAESIGVTAQDAGSRGKLAAQMLANPGLGELDASLAGGEDFFTEESLVPLTDLLGQREDAAKPPNFLQFNPISAPAAPNIQMPNFTMPTPMALPPRPVPVTQTPAAGVAPVASGANPAANTGGAASGELSADDLMALIRAQSAPGTTGAIQAKADGGLAEGMYMGDEEGPELHIPLGPGEALVIPHGQVKNFLRNVSDVQGMKKGGMFKDGKQAPVAADMVGMGINAMADGGFFSEGNIFGTAQPTDQAGTMTFLAEALKRALSGTPWQQQGRAPTPVEVSAPGTDPIVQELGGSLSALGTGTPQDLFLRRARALKPQGITESAGGLRRSG
jgi:hypothetical protein